MLIIYEHVKIFIVTVSWEYVIFNVFRINGLHLMAKRYAVQCYYQHVQY